MAPLAAAAGLEVSPRCPLNAVSPISQPEPDLADRRLVTHRDPVDDRYEDVAAMTDADVVTAARLPLTVADAELLPPRR